MFVAPYLKLITFGTKMWKGFGIFIIHLFTSSNPARSISKLAYFICNVNMLGSASMTIFKG